MSATPRSARAKLAIHQRWHPDDEEGLAERKRDLKLVNLEKHVRKALEDWPPLTDEQKDRIATLLRSS